MSRAFGVRASGALPLSHILLGLAVVAVWGTNFVVIKYALAHLPPLALATLRFALAAFPALLVIRRPAASWRNLAAYGLLIGVAQFGLLFIAMTRFISPGLASLVVQVQVFFTIGMAMLLAGERVRVFQLLAMALSVAGIALIGWHAVTDGAAITPLGLVLILLAALAWACGNIVSRAAGRVEGARLVKIGYACMALAMVANVGAIQGQIRVAPDAEPDDGRLDVVIASLEGPLDWGPITTRILARAQDAEGVERAQAASVVFHTPAPVPYQIDGDAMGACTRLEARSLARVLEIMVPGHRR